MSRAPLRIAAVADLHMRDSVAGRFRPDFLRSTADVLLLGGDLTEGGGPHETDLLCAEIAGLAMPVVAVLGNHDHDRQLGYRIAAMLSALGVGVGNLAVDLAVRSTARGTTCRDRRCLAVQTCTPRRVRR